MNAEIKIVCPFDSIDLTKGKEYRALIDYGANIFCIKNDIGESITVNAESSLWTFNAPWKIIK